MAIRLPGSWRAALELASRFGYAARGSVYLIVGVIALLAALDLAPAPRGAREVFASWAEWPPGVLLLALLAGGLVGFSLWRALQTLFDADSHGGGAKGWAVRAGQAVSGVIYGLLAWSVFELLDGIEDIGEADETEEAQAAAAAFLALPHGDLLLIAAGLALFGVGAGNVIQGAAQDFAKRLQCSEAVCRWASPLARAGYIGRGLATFPLGVFLFRAGLEARSSEARTWSDALQAVEAQPFGGLVLSLMAAGLIAFGLFGLVEAVWRRIEPPRLSRLPSPAAAPTARSSPDPRTPRIPADTRGVSRAPCSGHP